MISVCRRRSVSSKRGWKSSVKSVSSVREKTFTKYASSLIGVSRWLRPSLRGRGWGRGHLLMGSKLCAKRLSELCALCERKNLYEVCKQPNRGNLTYHAPPCGGGVGGGATSSWARNVRQKAQWTLCALWENKLPSESQAFFLTWRVRSISNRFTQKNRTHGIPQRH